MAHVLLINGPNLNLLGTREPGVYGSTTLAQIEQQLAAQATGLGHGCDSVSEQCEAELVDRVQQASGKSDFIILNPGAFTHTSVALRDALLAVEFLSLKYISATCMPVRHFASTRIFPISLSAPSWDWGRKAMNWP